MVSSKSPLQQPAIVPFDESPTQYEVLFSDSVDNLPEPLPSTDIIEAAPIIKKLTARCVVEISASYVAKYGYEIELLEAENMMFVRKNTNIRVPQVFAVYRRYGKMGQYITYIIMERLSGESLDTLWDNLSTAQRLDISRRLKHSFDSLRSLPHQGYFGSLGKTKLQDLLFETDDPVPSMNGPFETEEKLIDGLIEKYLSEGPERLRQRAAYYQHVLPRTFRGDNKPVFTHADLQLKNLMLQSDGSVAIIDWAASGWYPRYWEYAVALCANGGWTNDWHTYVGYFLEEFPNHFVWMSRIRMERWY